jgi:hypothetical protein
MWGRSASALRESLESDSRALALAMSYRKVGFAGVHTDSNHRLMYTWA